MDLPYWMPRAEDLPALGLIFLVTATVAFILMSIWSLFQREVNPGEEPTRRTFGAFTPLIAGLLPGFLRRRERITRDLLRAGFFEPVAEVNFSAFRSLSTYLPILGGEAGSLLTEGNLSYFYFGFGIISGLIGYLLPWIILLIVAYRRTEQVRRGLPMLMDTLGLSLSTGASLPEAFSASGHAIQRGYPALSQEVRVVRAQADLRSLSHALDAWKNRQPLAELGSLVFLLSQADRFGTDITRGLWELSASLQTNARQRAEASANRANFFMSFPTVLCLLVSAGIILAGPGIAQVIESNREARKMIDKAKDFKNEIGQQAPPPKKSRGASALAPLVEPPSR